MAGRLISITMVLLALYGRSNAASMPEAASDYQNAERLFAAARYREAIPVYQKALAAPPASVGVGDVYSRIGDAYFRLGYFRGALDAYRNAIEKQRPSERPQTQYWIGFCCFLLGKDAEAVAELLKVPQLDPRAKMWAATAYYWAGRASERLGKKDQAAAFYKKAGGSGKSTQGRFAMKRAEAVKGR